MVLHDFVLRHRAEIVTRARLRIGERIAPIPTGAELDVGVDLFLEELMSALAPVHSIAINDDGANRVRQPLLRAGFSIAQVVYDYGDICQAITELVGERDEIFEAREFRVLNQCLDDAIASAVTEFARRRDIQANDRQSERLNAFAERLRSLLATARLAFEMVQRGTVGPSGSTGALIARSLTGLRRSIDQTLALERLDSKSAVTERVEVSRLVEEIEVSCTIEARGRGLRFGVAVHGRELHVFGDRDILLSAITLIVEAAIQGTARTGMVTLDVEADEAIVRIDVTASGLYAVAALEADGLALARQAFEACGGTFETSVLENGRRHRANLTRAAIA